MTKALFERRASTCSAGTIGHVDHGKTSLLAALTAVLAPRPTIPDRVAVWNWAEFNQTMQASQSVVMSDPATKYPTTLMGFPIFVDEALAPGTVELRNGKEVVRVLNLKS
jgi:hypothetical protein